MEELINILEETAAFEEKYCHFSSPIDFTVNSEFYSQEEMSTNFVYNTSTYFVHQIWSRNLFHNNYVITIYKNGKETNLDIFFVRSVLAEITATQSRSKLI